jgi:peptidyl-prolyl cis-trans isomerase SurA
VVAAMRILVWSWLALLVSAGSAGAVPAQPPAAASAPPAAAAPPGMEMRIAAVVNDDVISLDDLDSRIKMVELSTNLPDSPEVRQRLRPQVLRTMVDEKLQMQEAKKQHIAATDEELRKAIAGIEKQNGMKEGQLNDFLKQHGINRGTLLDQVTASIVWAKEVRRLASETDPVSDDEIDAAMKRIEANKEAPEIRVAEIFLAVDRPDQDAEVLQLAQRLSDQMRQGTRFSAVAQQFSQSATAAVGGDLGWLRPDQMAPELAKAVINLQPGELSPPIRTAAGYYLLLVLDRHNGGGAPDTQDTILHVVQVVMPLPQQPSEAMRNAALAQLAQISAGGKTCPDLLRLGREKAPRLSSEGRLRASQIAPALRNILMKMPVGQVTPPILQKNGIGIIMVCDRSTPQNAPLTREEVADSLMRQRLDTLARRYMEDLRRAAYVDVRI